MAFATIPAMAAACGDWDVVAGAGVDAEPVHAATEPVARQSEIAIATDLAPWSPSRRACLTTLTYSHQQQE
jgi:hypothetical protein